MVVALIVRGIVTEWIVSWLALIADRLSLNRYVSRTCYEVLDIVDIERYCRYFWRDIIDKEGYCRKIWQNIIDIVGHCRCKRIL